MTTSACKQIVLLWIFLLCAVAFTSMYFDRSAECPAATFDKLGSFTANRPFQFRVLIPALVHVIQLLYPFVPSRELFFVLNVAIVFLLLVISAAYFSRFTDQRTANLSAFLMLYPMVWNYCVFGLYVYVSDIAAILFFTMGLRLLNDRRYGVYYLLFGVATLNRETSCFLTLAFVLTQWSRVSLRALILHGLTQAALWVVLKGALAHVFASNGGPDMFALCWRGNVAALLDEGTRARTIAAFAFGCVWLLIPFGWKETPGFMKRLLWIVPPYLIGMFLVARIGEVRAFAELTPVFVGPAIFGLRKIARDTTW